MNKILITGGNGYIGSALFKRLLSEDKNVYAGIRRNSTHEREVKIPALSANAEWMDILKEYDIVVHTAGRAHILNDTAENRLEEFRKINTEGTLKLANDAARSGVKRFVFISSIGVHGQFSAKPLDETDKLNPLEDYAVSKYEAEQGLMRTSKEMGLDVVIIRPPLVYGENAPGNYGKLKSAIINGSVLPLGCINKNSRTFIGIDNLVDFIAVCIEHPRAVNEVFLAADDESVSTAEFVRLIGMAYHVKPLLLNIPVNILRVVFLLMGKIDVYKKITQSLEVKNSKSKKILGWLPPYSLTDGLMLSARNEMAGGYKK